MAFSSQVVASSFPLWCGFSVLSLLWLLSLNPWPIDCDASRSRGLRLLNPAEHSRFIAFDRSTPDGSGVMLLRLTLDFQDLSPGIKELNSNSGKGRDELGILFCALLCGGRRPTTRFEPHLRSAIQLPWASPVAKRRSVPMPTGMVIVVDNTPRENKNSSVLTFMALLQARHMFRSTRILFLRVIPTTFSISSTELCPRAFTQTKTWNRSRRSFGDSEPSLARCRSSWCDYHWGMQKVHCLARNQLLIIRQSIHHGYNIYIPIGFSTNKSNSRFRPRLQWAISNLERRCDRSGAMVAMNRHETWSVGWLDGWLVGWMVGFEPHKL